MRDVGYFVFDEADTLFAQKKGFEEDLSQIFKLFEVYSKNVIALVQSYPQRRIKAPLPEGEVPIKFVAATATLTPTLLESIRNRLPVLLAYVHNFINAIVY